MAPSFVVMAFASVAMGRPLECRLSAEKTVPTGRPVMVRFTLRNPGPKPVSVLIWQTPLEGLLGNLFDVRGPDGAVPYSGPMVKRGDPDADEYVRIEGGAEVSDEVDVTAAYDLSRPGRYTVAFRGRLFDVTTPASVPRRRDLHQAVPVACPPLEIAVLGP